MINLKNKNSRKKYKAIKEKYSNKSKIFIILVFTIFLLSKLSVFNCLGFVSIGEAKLIIREFEKCYLYNNVFKDKKYIEIKKKIFLNGFTTKSKIYDLVSEAKVLAKDDITELRYVNFLQGKFRHSFNKGLHIGRKYIDGDTIYVKLDNFHEGMASKFSRMLERENGITRLVLDLRDNEIGSYTEAIQIADVLLPEGNIIAHIECPNSVHLYLSNSFHYDFSEIYVLVNKKSGYCAEMVALSLKENLKDKVRIIGDKTMEMGVGFIIKEYNSRIAINIAHLNWNVKGKSAIDLNKHIYSCNDIESKDKSGNICLKKIMELIEH